VKQCEFSRFQAVASDEDYTNIYGEYGFITLSRSPISIFNDDTKIIDLPLKVDEQKAIHVRRIDFTAETHNPR